MSMDMGVGRVTRVAEDLLDKTVLLGAKDAENPDAATMEDMGMKGQEFVGAIGKEYASAVVPKL